MIVQDSRCDRTSEKASVKTEVGTYAEHFLKTAAALCHLKDSVISNNVTISISGSWFLALLC